MHARNIQPASLVPSIVETIGGLAPHSRRHAGYLTGRARGRGAVDRLRYHDKLHQSSARAVMGCPCPSSRIHRPGPPPRCPAHDSFQLPPTPSALPPSPYLCLPPLPSLLPTKLVKLERNEEGDAAEHTVSSVRSMQPAGTKIIARVGGSLVAGWACRPPSPRRPHDRRSDATSSTFTTPSEASDPAALPTSVASRRWCASARRSVGCRIYSA